MLSDALLVIALLLTVCLVAVALVTRR